MSKQRQFHSKCSPWHTDPAVQIYYNFSMALKQLWCHHLILLSLLALLSFKSKCLLLGRAQKWDTGLLNWDKQIKFDFLPRLQLASLVPFISDWLHFTAHKVGTNSGLAGQRNRPPLTPSKNDPVGTFKPILRHEISTLVKIKVQFTECLPCKNPFPKAKLLVYENLKLLTY